MSNRSLVLDFLTFQTEQSEQSSAVLFKQQQHTPINTTPLHQIHSICSQQLSFTVQTIEHEHQIKMSAFERSNVTEILNAELERYQQSVRTLHDNLMILEENKHTNLLAPIQEARKREDEKLNMKKKEAVVIASSLKEKLERYYEVINTMSN